MKTTASFGAALLGAFAAFCSATPTPIPHNLQTRCKDHNNSTTTTTTTSRNATSTVALPWLPSDCMVSNAGIAWGWLPDDAQSNTVSLSSLNAATAQKACFYSDYSKINDASSYDGSDITYKAAYAADAGAVLVPSVMPVGVTWAEVTPSLADQIGAAVVRSLGANTTTDHLEGATPAAAAVYLRFAHEMNCYAKPGCAAPAYPGYDDHDAFKQAWANVARACHGITGCYMMWSPNPQDLLSLVADWWPGADYVDIIAVDHYPGDDGDVSGGFAGAYDAFYNEVVAPFGKPFMLGETAYGGDTETKNKWVQAIINSDFSDYPLFKGVMWFEYNKEADFYVISDAGQDAISKFNSNFS